MPLKFSTSQNNKTDFLQLYCIESEEVTFKDWTLKYDREIRDTPMFHYTQ